MALVKPLVLVLTQRYLPGYKGGGPARSLEALLGALKDDFDFRLLCEDRDAGDDAPYPGVAVDAWNERPEARVFYAKPPARGAIRRVLEEGDFDLVCLNSFFHPRFTLWPLLLRRLGRFRAPLLLAPRGEFSPGALGLKRGKKRLFLALARPLGLWRDVVFHATGEREPGEIRAALGHVEVRSARNLSVARAPEGEAPAKEAGAAELVFLSRIHPKKNLLAAIEALRGIRGRVTLRVVGPEADPAYAARCRQASAALPQNVTVDFAGEIPHERVPALLARHHLFLLPTLGENFGHVILEALLAGCPPLIADTTPWRNLAEAGVGWDLPLSAPGEFTARIQEVVDMDAGKWEEMSRRAAAYGRQRACPPEGVEENRRLLAEMAHV